MTIFLVSFNSTMVRLKGYALGFDVESDDKFQFHNGSIKSGQGIRIIDAQARVSIPQWFD